MAHLQFLHNKAGTFPLVLKMASILTLAITHAQGCLARDFPLLGLSNNTVHNQHFEAEKFIELELTVSQKMTEIRVGTPGETFESHSFRANIQMQGFAAGPGDGGEGLGRGLLGPRTRTQGRVPPQKPILPSFFLPACTASRTWTPLCRCLPPVATRRTPITTRLQHRFETGRGAGAERELAQGCKLALGQVQGSALSMETRKTARTAAKRRLTIAPTDLSHTARVP